MTARLRVGDRAMVHTPIAEPNWDGLEVVVLEVKPDGYWAQGGGFDSVSFFYEHELEYLPPAPSVFDRAWVRVAVLVVAVVVLALAVWGAR